MHLGWARELMFPDWSPMRAARIWGGLSQEELAEVVGCSRETISAIELGTSLPPVTLALAIAHALETSVEELFAVDELR
jgi:putative transcriptional regulator